MKKPLFLPLFYFLFLTKLIYAQDTDYYECLGYDNICEENNIHRLMQACDVYPGANSNFNLTGKDITIGIFENTSGFDFSNFCIDCSNNRDFHYRGLMYDGGFYKTGDEAAGFMDCEGNYRIVEDDESGCGLPFQNYCDDDQSNMVDCKVIQEDGYIYCEENTLSYNVGTSWGSGFDFHYGTVGNNAAGFGQDYKLVNGQFEYVEYKRGIAPLAKVKFYNNYTDKWECEASNGLLIANMAMQFGCNNYDEYRDRILHEEKYHLLCTAAGNKQGVPGGCEYINNSFNNIDYKRYYNICGAGSYKNSLSVGAQTANDEAILPVNVGHQSAGPTIDGRIKPDVLGFSTNGSHNATTSWCSPTAAGTAALLHEQWNNYSNRTYNSSTPLSSTMKGIIIHTASFCEYDEIFESDIPYGPNYRCGWGTIDVSKAAHLIAENDTEQIIFENTLQNEEKHTYYLSIDEFASQEELKITIVWNDVPGSDITADPSGAFPTSENALVNDLDIKLIKADCLGEEGSEYGVWKLNPNMDSGLDFHIASRDPDITNDLDNIEQVYLFPEEVEAGKYILEIWHKDELLNFDYADNGQVFTIGNGQQDYSLIVSGASVSEEEPDIFNPSFTETTICQGDAITLGVEPNTLQNIQWSPFVNIDDVNSVAPTVAPLQTTIYEFNSTDPNINVSGCNQVLVNVIPEPEVIITPSQTTLCSNDDLTVNVSGNIDAFDWQYLENGNWYSLCSPNSVCNKDLSLTNDEISAILQTTAPNSGITIKLIVYVQDESGANVCEYEHVLSFEYEDIQLNTEITKPVGQSISNIDVAPNFTNPNTMISSWLWEVYNENNSIVTAYHNENFTHAVSDADSHIVLTAITAEGCMFTETINIYPLLFEIQGLSNNAYVCADSDIEICVADAVNIDANSTIKWYENNIHLASLNNQPCITINIDAQTELKAEFFNNGTLLTESITLNVYEQVTENDFQFYSSNICVLDSDDYLNSEFTIGLDHSESIPQPNAVIWECIGESGNYAQITGSEIESLTNYECLVTIEYECYTIQKTVSINPHQSDELYFIFIENDFQQNINNCNTYELNPQVYYNEFNPSTNQYNYPSQLVNLSGNNTNTISIYKDGTFYASIPFSNFPVNLEESGYYEMTVEGECNLAPAVLNLQITKANMTYNPTINHCVNDETLYIHFNTNGASIDNIHWTQLPSGISTPTVDTNNDNFFLIDNFSANAAGNYEFTVTMGDCEFEGAFEVIFNSVDEIPIIESIIGESTSCGIQSSVLSIANLAAYGDNYYIEWYDENDNLITEAENFEVNANGVYYAKVFGAFGCSVDSEPINVNAGFDICADCNTTTDILIGEQVSWGANSLTSFDVNNTGVVEVDGIINVYGRLIVDGITLQFTPNSKIIVHENAYLTIRNNATLTACENLWQGIEVRGNSNHSEFGIYDDYANNQEIIINGIPKGVLGINANGNHETVATNLGLIDVYNEALIEKAVIAIDAGIGEKDGIVIIGNAIEDNSLADNQRRSAFNKNLVDIHIDYTSCCGLGSNGNGYSSIRYADFYRGGEDYGIKISNANELKIEDITMENAPNLTTKSNGIYAVDTKIQLERSNFESLVNGVFISRPYTDNATAQILNISEAPNYIADNFLNNVEKGIYITGSYYGDVIERNQFLEIPDLLHTSPTQAQYLSDPVFSDISSEVSPITFGLYMSKFDFGRISENVFAGAVANASGTSYGLIADPRGGYNGTQNFFSDADGNTSYDLIACNIFDRTDIGYQHQNGTSAIKVRENEFASNGEVSHDFSAWTVLRHVNEDAGNYAYKLENYCDVELFFNRWMDFNTNASLNKHIFSNTGAFTDEYIIDEDYSNTIFAPISNNIDNYYNDICQSPYEYDDDSFCTQSYSGLEAPTSEVCEAKQNDLTFITTQIANLSSLIQENECTQVNEPTIATPWNLQPQTSLKRDKFVGGSMIDGIRPVRPTTITPPCEEPTELVQWKMELEELEHEQILLMNYIASNCLNMGTVGSFNKGKTAIEEFIDLLEGNSNTFKLDLQLADLYLKIGAYEASRNLMDDLSENSYSEEQWNYLCRKRAINEVKIQRGLKAQEWKDLDQQELKVLKRLAFGKDAIGQEAKTILATIETKPYFAPILNAAEYIDPVNKRGENDTELLKSDIEIYPNPVLNELYIDTANEAISEINIIDLNGRVIRKYIFISGTPIDLSELISGMYFVLLKDAKGYTIHSHKIIKE